jgi:tRNA threonylcarbamoyladenosine biosynthesis protein TsaE
LREVITKSEIETFELGREYGMAAKAGDVYSLTGDLGAGKTVFAKGFAAGLGIKEAVTSPTFTIVREYQNGRLPFFHFDVYRLESEDELWEIGFDEYLNCDGVVLVEWGNIVAKALPDNTITINIERKDDDVRRILCGF